MLLECIGVLWECFGGVLGALGVFWGVLVCLGCFGVFWGVSTDRITEYQNKYERSLVISAHNHFDP